MEWKIDRQASKPLYQQIFEIIEEKFHMANFRREVYCRPNGNWLSV